MEYLIFYIALILLGITFWFQSRGIVITKNVVVNHPKIIDFHSVFSREGVDVDEETYREVCEFVENSNIEAAEYLMMMRCKSPVAKIRCAIAELYAQMRGGW